MGNKLIWEEIPQSSTGWLFRMPVVGGWLVKCIDEVLTPTFLQQGRFERSPEMEWRTSITFVPDPNHEWDLGKDYSPQPKQEPANNKDFTS